MGFLDQIGQAIGGGITNAGKLVSSVVGHPVYFPGTGQGGQGLGSLITNAYASDGSNKVYAPTSSGSGSGGYSPANASYGPSAGATGNLPTTTTNNNNGGGSNNNQPSPGGSSSNPVLDAAQLALQAAKNQYGYLSGQLKNEQTDLGSQKDSLLNQIGSLYGNTIQTAKDTLANNLDTLNTSKGTVTQGYEGLKNEQGRLLTDTQRQNRQTARALGDLGSSFYENLQSDAGANTAKNISNFSNEEQGQLDQIANEITNENTTSATKISNLNDLETQAKQDVLNKYQSSWNNIQNDLAATGMNSQQAYDQINNEMQSTLDNISYYMNQYKTDVLNTGQSNISQNGINDYLNTAKNSFGAMSAVNPSASPIGNSTALGNAQADIVNMANSGATTDQIIGQIQAIYGLDPTTIQGMLAQAGIGNTPGSTLSNLFPSS